MSVVLFVLGAWVLVSVAMGFLLGWACGLNQLSSDAGAPIAVAPDPAPAPEGVSC
jgi:hypothetical protein